MPELTAEITEVAAPAAPPPATEAGDPRDTDALVERELLVEDVSIDGMCGVY